jgi:hypothetical protein
MVVDARRAGACARHAGRRRAAAARWRGRLVADAGHDGDRLFDSPSVRARRERCPFAASWGRPARATAGPGRRREESMAFRETPMWPSMRRASRPELHRDGPALDVMPPKDRRALLRRHRLMRGAHRGSHCPRTAGRRRAFNGRADLAERDDLGKAHASSKPAVHGAPDGAARHAGRRTARWPSVIALLRDRREGSGVPPPRPSRSPSRELLRRRPGRHRR